MYLCGVKCSLKQNSWLRTCRCSTPLTATSQKVELSERLGRGSQIHLDGFDSCIQLQKNSTFAVSNSCWRNYQRHHALLVTPSRQRRGTTFGALLF